MIRLEVRLTAIVLHNYQLGDCSRLENYFKKYNRITHSYEYIGFHYDEDMEALYLPRGMDIPLIEKLSGRRVEVDPTYSCNEYDRYEDQIKLTYPPRNEVQKEALRFMVGLKPYQATANKSQLLLNLTTGKGKTYISIATMAYLGIKSIIITSSVDWLAQWEERIAEHSNIRPREMYTITGNWCINRLRNDDRIIDRTKVFLVTHSTIRNYADKYGWEEVRYFFKEIRVGLKFIDEAHVDFKNILMIDYYSDVYKTYYITATFGRSSEDENRIYQMCFKNVLGIDLYNKQEDAHTSYVALFFKSLASASEISSCKGKLGLDRNKYIKYLASKENYYKLISLIMDIVLPKTKDGSKALFYIGNNEVIQNTYNWILSNYPELREDVGIFSMISNDKSAAKTKRIILSTTKSAGACVDIANLKVTVILNEPFKSELLAQQSLGRTRDKDTLCIECVDIDFYHCKKMYYAKKKVYAKYATDCSEIRLSQDDLDLSYNNLKIRNMNINPIKENNQIQKPSKGICPFKRYKEGELIQWYHKVD